MRSLSVFAGLLACLALTPPPTAPAQLPQIPAPAAPAAPKTETTAMTVVVPRVAVRCGGSEKFYPTMELDAGAQVEVIGKSQKFPGWVAIKPPVGSFSWIDGKRIKEMAAPNNKLAMVVGADDTTPASILAGSIVYNQEPNVEVAKVDRGTIVTILGSPNYTTGNQASHWYPIAPTEGEVRYLPESAVKKVDLPTKSVDPKTKDVLDKVALAEKNVIEARKILEDAYKNTTDPVQKQDLAYKLAQLPQITKTSAANLTPGHPTLGNPYHQASTQGNDNTKVFNANLATTGGNGQPQWSAWGTLRAAGFQKDGQAMFVLTGQKGEPLLYAVAEQGKSLDPHIGRFVSLYGVTTYNTGGYPRREVITVSHVGLPDGAK